MNLGNRLKHAWNAFNGRDPTPLGPPGQMVYSSNPSRHRFTYGNQKSIVSGVYNQIAMDISAIDIEHVRLDENGNFKETIDSGLNNCLTLEANIDQTSRAFIQDLVMSMFDEGVVAIVPTDTSIDPRISTSYDILELRVGKILQWYPSQVMVRVYNERLGIKEDKILPKSMVGIVENPLYAVMNEPNSTLQRLIRVLNNLDYLNEQNCSGKLDLIIQLPYVIKSQERREQAERRRKDIEAQLVSSKYGIAYSDGTEKIVQLNRAIDNTLWTQAKDLTSMLYSQLGLTETIFNGTADEKTMLNYYSRTIDPILSAITQEMIRKFLTKTGRTQGQSIKYFRDPFRLVPVMDLAEIADKMTRNEILSSNEVRAIIGYKPSSDPEADELRNKNLNAKDQVTDPASTEDTADAPDVVDDE
jgi:hypothetical protein